MRKLFVHLQGNRDAAERNVNGDTMRKLFVHLQALQQALALLAMIILPAWIAGCTFIRPATSPWKPPPGFQAIDLVGEWKVVSDVYPVDETLLLNLDGSFFHQYQVPHVTSLYVDRGNWWIEQRPSGCVFLYLEGMRYFHSTLDVANNGNRALTGTPIRFEEPCEQRTFEMPDMVIMTVGSLPRYPRSLTIFFPRTYMEGPYVTMRLHRTNVPETISPTMLRSP